MYNPNRRRSSLHPSKLLQSSLNKSSALDHGQPVTAHGHHPNCPVGDPADHTHPPGTATEPYCPLPNSALQAIDAIEYITEHLRREEEVKLSRNDWKYVAMVIDRLLLYIFFGVTLGGTLGIILSAPYVFHAVDQQTELDRLIRLYKSGGL